LEDDLFIKYRLYDFLPVHRLDENMDGELDNQIIRKSINRLQTIIEGQNLEIKKTLCKYVAIIEKQREKIFEERTFFMTAQNALEFFKSASPEKFKVYQTVLNFEKLNHLCKRILVSSIDTSWSQYLMDIGEIREEIHFCYASLRLAAKSLFFVRGVTLLFTLIFASLRIF
jgi:preprotein translocase subunit SecA